MRVPWCRLTWWTGCSVWSPDYIGETRIPAPPDARNGRKGWALRTLWHLYRDNHPGFVVLDPDMAIEPTGVVEFEERYIAQDPASVWVVPYRLWIPSHYRTTWSDVAPEQMADQRAQVAHNPDGELVGNRLTLRPRPAGVWGHRVMEDGKMRWGRPDDTGPIDYWGFGCTYLPNRLMERMDELQAWDEAKYPLGDVKVNQVAMEEPRIVARLAPTVHVCHMHWNAESVEAVALRYAEMRAAEASAPA